MTYGEIGGLIAAVGVICSIIFGFIGYKKGIKQDANAEGSLRSDIGYIKSGVDDLKNEQKELNRMHYNLSDRVARVEESTKSAHHRIDGLEARMEENK